jgi:hypothetical protein
VGKPGRLNGIPHRGACRKPPGQDSDTKLEDVESPRRGPGCAYCGPPFCIILSLALFALGGADPTGEFCLRTLSFSRPMTIL